MSASSRSPDLPRLGPRGEGWVAIQLALIVLVPLSALTGIYWPERVAGVFTVVGIVLILVGLVLMVLAFARLTLARAMTVFPRPREHAALAERGVYRLVRHPIYGGLIVTALGVSLVESPLALIPAALLAVVVDVKARLEEGWLVERQPGYAAYRERTPRRFVPGLY
jgi:protein-S-isoprenylcysteine O-methyltransferase Ste14